MSTWHDDVEEVLQHESRAIQRANAAASGKPACPDWRCQECGKRFRTTKSIHRALSIGCPKCNSGDIQEVAP